MVLSSDETEKPIIKRKIILVFEHFLKFVECSNCVLLFTDLRSLTFKTFRIHTSAYARTPQIIG